MLARFNFLNNEGFKLTWIIKIIVIHFSIRIVLKNIISLFFIDKYGVLKFHNT
jgi:hypothetical protein